MNTFGKALQLLEDRGWVQGSVNGREECRRGTCVGGAIALAAVGSADAMYDDYPEVEEALKIFADHVNAAGPSDDDPYMDAATRVYKWNDDNNRVSEEVFTALRELADV